MSEGCVIIVLSQRAVMTKGVKMLKFKELQFKELNQCQQCGDLVKSGVNVTPSIIDWVYLTWVCQDCSKEWEV
jgi:hypothetical protein